MLFRIIPPRLIQKTNESELIVYFKNGSYLHLKGADDPDALRGAGPMGIVLDEFATMRPEVWGVVEPILRANDGWCWFIGTPKGKNHLYHHYMRGLTDSVEWYSNLMRASTSGVIRDDQLAETKLTSSPALYNQEYECEFLEGVGSVFRNVKEACTSSPEQPQDDRNYVIGVDLGKAQDFTVLAVYDRKTNKQVYQDRFQQLEWPFQKQKIISIAKHYNNAKVMLDATGLGDPIADDLGRSGLSVEPFKISEPSKKDIIEKLSIWIEQRKIQLLPIEETIHELDSFSYEIGPTGKLRYSAPAGLHDDIVLAHALAVWDLNPTYTVAPVKIQTPIQVALQKAKNDFVNTVEDYGEWAS